MEWGGSCFCSNSAKPGDKCGTLTFCLRDCLWIQNGDSVASAGLVAAAMLTDKDEKADQADEEGGTKAAAAPVAVGNVLRVIAAAKVRASSALDSEQVGMLLEDERILVLEVVTLSLTVEIQHESEEEDNVDESDSSGEGLDEEFDVDRPEKARTTSVVRRHRVRFHRGWASVRASDGDLLLVADDGSAGSAMPEPEPEVTFLGLGGFVGEAASEAVKMLSQSEATKRLTAERQAAAERAQAAGLDAELSSVAAEIAGLSSAADGQTAGGGVGGEDRVSSQANCRSL